MQPSRKKISLLATFITILALVSCSDDDPVNIGIVTLQTDPTLGQFLVDGNGKTLYVFAKDVSGESKCTGGCLQDWPVYYATTLEPGVGVDMADFSTITRSDGASQTTYKGWPLYYYAGDVSAGDTNGEAVGQSWFVAKPDYSIMLASAQLVGKDGKNYTSAYVEGDGETQYFVDANGRTLYTFSRDFKDVNKFTAADGSNNGVWPIFHVDIDALPSTLNANDFGEIDVHGSPQLTYKGNPLYYFGEDANRGENKGVSFPMPGIWPVAGPQTPAAQVQPTITVRNDPTFGSVLTDNQNRTLYFFARDTKGVSNCAGACLNRWPLFSVDEIIVPQGGVLEASDFAIIGDGDTKQVTFKGRPLYYYAPANDGVIDAPAQNTGDNFATVWFVAKPDYSLMVAVAQLVGHDGKNYTDAYVEGTGVTRYFTDAEGRTLYSFTNDSENTNTFTAADFSNDAVWPIFHTTITELPTGLNADDFGEIDVHGRQQLTFKGWPLYYFGQDVAQGDNKGISFPTPGKWPVVNGNSAAAPQ
jgi:predicted lipoprotein with Yx(FWY)xxD motif